MNIPQAIDRVRQVLRRQHKALATEESYVFWLRCYIAGLRGISAQLSSEKQVEAFLTQLARRMEAARAVWERDRQYRTPLMLPHQLARKYPEYQFSWPWAWLFPAHSLMWQAYAVLSQTSSPRHEDLFPAAENRA